MSDLTKDQVVEWLSNLILQVKELTDELEETWGVSAAAAVAVAAGPAAGLWRRRCCRREDEFDVVLTSAGAKKIGSSRLFERQPSLVSRKLRNLLTVHQRLSRKLSQRQKLMSSLRKFPKRAAKSKLSKRLLIGDSAVDVESLRHFPLRNLPRGKWQWLLGGFAQMCRPIAKCSN